MRPDMYLEAMKEIGVTRKVAEEQKITLFDGIVRRQGSREVRAVVPDHTAHRRRPGGCRSAKRRLGRTISLPAARAASAGAARRGGAPAGRFRDLPSPLRTWEESKLYILEPFAKRGEMDQGIGLLAYYSLVRVAKGFLLGIAIATPLGFLLGVSPTLTRMFDPVMQVLRPISPLAWLPLGLILFQKSEPAALFAIAVCSMWPTVINTMAGVRAIPQDYWNVAKVLRLSRIDDVH